VQPDERFLGDVRRQLGVAGQAVEVAVQAVEPGRVQRAERLLEGGGPDAPVGRAGVECHGGKGERGGMHVEGTRQARGM